MAFLVDLAAATFERAANCVLPRSCLLCGARGPALCAACHAEAIDGLLWQCPLCAAPLMADPAGHACGRCLRTPPAFDATWATALYAPPFDQLIRGLKYAAHLQYAPVLADLLAARCRRHGAHATLDCLLPVPLARERMAGRGFNQSIEIARHLARDLQRPMDTRSILRIHDTPPQAALRFAQRRRNMRGAFAVALSGADALKGRTVGVVDDVMTTGATLDALARVLKRAGVRTVINLVVARTP